MRSFFLLAALSLGLVTTFHPFDFADSGEYISRPHREHLFVKLANGSPAASWQLKRALAVINGVADQEFFVMASVASPDVEVKMTKNIENNPGILGVCNIVVESWKAEVQIVTGLNDKQRVAVMTHEMIHSLGITHSTNPNSIMFFSTNSRPNSQVMTDDDILNIRSAIEDFQTKN